MSRPPRHCVVSATPQPSDLPATVSVLPQLTNSNLLSTSDSSSIFRCHECDQDPLGPSPRRQCRCARLPLGGTQWVAWRLAFQPQLGHPCFNILGWPVYDPPAFFWWWFAYDAYARPIFVEGAYIAASGGIAAVVVAIAMSVWRAREVKKVTTYGSARWAETRKCDLRASLATTA